eukprot:GILJ01006686.1.p1 GENE.GILJ01006686.1~~GILJ01006686.1.p1  ORF type:complete len:125 (+),score=17.64 GILJ01006686.1:39-377(+)
MSIRASHILQKHSGSRRPFDSYRNVPVTRSKEEAIRNVEDIKRRLVAGEATFEKLAQQVSECSSARNGGDLGEFQRGVMQKAFEDVAFALQVGELSELVDTDSGIHVILRTA